jgi:hypothetical protein
MSQDDDNTSFFDRERDKLSAEITAVRVYIISKHNPL